MPKVALKEKTAIKQNGECALSKKKLPKETKLYDTHRKTPKRKGGDYTKKNTSVVIPISHMEEHDTLRERTADLEKLKMVIDDREQVRKVLNKFNNQLLAMKRRTDKLSKGTVDWLECQKKEADRKLREIDKTLVKTMKEINIPLATSALGVKGIGPVTVAYCLVYIDLTGIDIKTGREKARHASSLWSYAGLDKASHERYTKGEAGGGNKSLRTVLYTMADSQMKTKGAYREVYDRVKSRLEISEKVTKSRNTQGQLIECKWKDTKPCHRHGAALRAVMKHFLADYWMVGRTLAGLDTSPLYAEAVLGKGHRTIMPEERGWKY
jgi:hypothetical protein